MNASESEPPGEMTGEGWRVPLSDLLVDDDLLGAARDALASGWWSMGPRVTELERRFATYANVRHALAVSSGTAALHLALLATRCGPGDEVVLPSLNFVAAANAVVAVGATPVFCDITGAGDLNLDPGDLERAITTRTKAVIVLHYGGYPCDLDAVLGIAREHSIFVIEDAAHAPGSRLLGRQLGTFGDAGCFSFFSNKNLPVGEGGMVVTPDDEVADRLGLLRSHGMTTLTWQRHQGHASSYDVREPGFNYRMDEMRAALACVQLERLPATNAARGRIVARYRELLNEVPGLSVPFESATSTDSAHHLAVVVLPAGVDRDVIRTHLTDERIQTSVHYPPIHHFSAYRDSGGRQLPRTDAFAGRILTLPLFAHMSDEQIVAVSDALVDALR